MLAPVVVRCLYHKLLLCFTVTFLPLKREFMNVFICWLVNDVLKTLSVCCVLLIEQVWLVVQPCSEYSTGTLLIWLAYKLSFFDWPRSEWYVQLVKSVCPSVHLFVSLFFFSLYFLTDWPLTLIFCLCMDHDRRFHRIKVQGHGGKSKMKIMLSMQRK